MLNYKKETLDLELCKRRIGSNPNLGEELESMNNGNRGNLEKEIILNYLDELMDDSEDIRQVLNYLCFLDIKNNTKIKIVIQKQDFENSINTTYEKIIVK